MPTTDLRTRTAAALFCLAAGPLACGDDVENPLEDNPNEVITTVTLTFAPTAGGPSVEAQFRDPDGDGGEAPTITGVTLTETATYTMTVEFLNELETPAEDITPEILNEQDEHQTFLVGDVVSGPGTLVPLADALIRHEYADMDTNGFPIGLTSEVFALRAGTGTFSFGLRHMPLVNGAVVKTGDLAQEVADGEGFTALSAETTLPGSWDVVVDIPLTVE